MENKHSGLEIGSDKRQNWQSIAMVWIGSMICVSSLMVGGMLGNGMRLLESTISIIIGYSIICVYMCCMGMQGCDTGLPTASMAGSSLGRSGAKYVISIILAVACIGWFGIQAGVCGASFSMMMESMTGISIPVWVSSILWGAIMLVSACFGFKGLKILNYIAVPLLVIVCFYALFITIGQGGGVATIKNYEPVNPLGFIDGINLTIGSFAVGGAIAGDYCRFAKNRGDVVKSSVLGVLPAGLVILLIGAVLSIVTGEYDISTVLSKAGVPAIGLVALILATWTTNVANAYSGGLSVSVLLDLDEDKSRIATAIAGLIGTVLAAFGILGKFTTFLSVLCAFVPALVGVMIADYWVIKKGDKTKFIVRDGVRMDGLIAFIIGSLIACITGGTFAGISWLSFLNHPFLIGPINGMVVAMVCYIILNKLMNKK